MSTTSDYHVIIVGGSFAGLSAGLSLGRALRKTLIFDTGEPCNRFSPHSHNFITHDGVPPATIASRAREQVLAYPTVEFRKARVTEVQRENGLFRITANDGSSFTALKLLFATGLRDQLPNIPGFAECWGKTVIHCPYCHGYEVRGQITGILARGEQAFELGKLIRNWTSDLTIYTSGPSGLEPEQGALLHKLGVRFVEKNISRLHHNDGKLRHIEFKDGSSERADALYAKVAFEQQCDLPARLGCEFTDMGHLAVDMLQKTSEDGIYAAGDSTIPFRSVSYAVSSGNIAGAALNAELLRENYERL